MIAIHNLTKKFDKETILKNLECTIPQGSIYGLVGPNGTGKSTLLRLISGIYKADEGEIIIDDEPVWDNDKAKRKILFVADDIYLIPGYSLKKMAKYYSMIFPEFDNELCRQLADNFKLPTDKSTDKFSKGMKRQAAVILALSVKADYYIFDETFDGLDPLMRKHVKSILCSKVADNNVTVIVSSHSLKELENFCDKLALLHDGGMVIENDVDDIKENYFKVQIGFPGQISREDFKNIDIIRYEQSGSVVNIIVNESVEKCVEKLKAMNPSLLDILPLSLEEVFETQMMKLGYKFDDIDLSSGGETK